MKRMPVQVYILSGSQALFQTVSIMMMAVGGLAGQMLAPSAELATLPIAAAGLGTLLTIFPASLWMSRAGRRAGFLTGTAAGVVAGMAATAGLYLHSFILLCAATFLIGIYQAFAQYYRFAAVEVAGSSAGSAAISLVLAGGVVAGVAGPWLARAGSALFTVPFMGSFLLLGMVALAGLLLMSGLNVPAGTHRVRDKKVRQTWYQIIARPVYLTALFSAATGFGIMVLAMTATPLAMQHHGYTLLQSTTVIQLHVLGMFLPSFITGRLIARYGVLNVMLAGAGFLLLYAVLSVSGQGYSTFTAALISVGIGWNFLYIGGTTLLSTAISEPENGFGQAFNDMSVAVCVLLCSLAAGRLLSTAGWERMNLMLVPWIVACAALLVLMKTLKAKRR